MTILEVVLIWGSMKRTNSIQLEKATNLVCTHWFPFNHETLDRALNIIGEASGDEESDKENCLDLLKTDSSLYLLCLKELQANFTRIRTRDSKFTSSLVDKVSIPELRNALDKVSKFRTHHILTEASESQTKRLTEILVSATAVCELSDSYHVSKELSYSSAILRQLGYTLIAWNYPKIYQKITERQLSKFQLDNEVRKYLGFSPSMLAMSVIERFGLDKEYEFLFTKISDHLKKNTDLKAGAAQIFSAINKICDVGEALARASNPELYLTAKDDLKYAEEEITSAIGTDGVRSIFLKVTSIAESSNKEIIKDNFSNIVEFDLSKSIEVTNYNRALRERNSYLDSLPSDVHEEVLRLYNRLEPGVRNKDNIKFFTNKIIPNTIFYSLTVYLVDPVEQILYPSLVIGRSRFQKPKSFSIKSYGEKNLLVSALHLNSPIREEFRVGDNSYNIIVSGIGDPVIGAFQVEFENLGYPSEIMSYFKAIRNVFCDCLMI